MKTKFLNLACAVALVAMVSACGGSSKTEDASGDTTAMDTNVVADDMSSDTTAGVMVGGAMMVPSKNIVENAMGSSDHTTLVSAVKAAGLVETLSGAGPFTVFAPTNAAFDKLPAGTVDDLMKPENKAKLQDILQYHVYVGSLKTDLMQDGQVLNEVNGGNITVSKKDGKIMLNNSATIIASIPASNGIIHVIDAVLLPPSK